MPPGAGSIPHARKCVKVPLGASGSSTTSASDAVPSGTPLQMSGGETSSPSHVCLRGIGCPCSNAGLVSSNSATPNFYRASAARARLARMIGNVGDTVVIESERADGTSRRGVIEEVLQEQPPRYRVRWEDGHTSILAPSAGSARIEQKKRPRAKAKA
jgi:Domain of unknown function (DUF1918)